MTDTPDAAALRARVAQLEYRLHRILDADDEGDGHEFIHALREARAALSAAPAARDDVVGAVSGATANYLRVCASGGMPKAQREAVQRAVDHAQRLGYYSMFMPAARSDVVDGGSSG